MKEVNFQKILAKKFTETRERQKERLLKERSKYFRKGRNVACPFRHLPSCVRAVLVAAAAAVCSVTELRNQTSYLNTTVLLALLLTQASLSFIEWMVIKN
jgi:hypothetical protein